MTAIPVVIAPAPACDCRRCPFYLGNPEALEPMCSGRNAGCSYCGCSASEWGHRSGACGECPIRCGSRVDIAAWMSDVGETFTFDDIPAPSPLPSGMPMVVPVVDGVATSLDERVSWGAYGIGLRRVFSPLTWDFKPLWAGEERDAHDALRVPATRRIILIGYGTDPLVEAFWTRRRSIYRVIAAKKFDLVLAPNYSMYGNQPRTEHLLNFRRNLLVAKEMQDAGIPAIPNLYWFRKEDLDRYLSWAEDVEPTALAVNLQTQRTDEDWEEMVLPGLTYLAACLDERISLVFNGTIRPDRVAVLVALFGERMVLVTQSPVQEARHGKVINPDGTVEKRGARPEDAFAASVKNVDEMVRRMLSAAHGTR